MGLSPPDAGKRGSGAPQQRLRRFRKQRHEQRPLNPGRSARRAPPPRPRTAAGCRTAAVADDLAVARDRHDPALDRADLHLLQRLAPVSKSAARQARAKPSASARLRRRLAACGIERVGTVIFGRGRVGHRPVCDGAGAVGQRRLRIRPCRGTYGCWTALVGTLRRGGCYSCAFTKRSNHASVRATMSRTLAGDCARLWLSPP